VEHVCGFGIGVVKWAFLAGEAANGGFADAAKVLRGLFAELTDGGADGFEARLSGGLNWARERGLSGLGTQCDWA
jgi:hypothetical protein